MFFWFFWFFKLIFSANKLRLKIIRFEQNLKIEMNKKKNNENMYLLNLVRMRDSMARIRPM